MRDQRDAARGDGDSSSAANIAGADGAPARRLGWTTGITRAQLAQAFGPRSPRLAVAGDRGDRTVRSGGERSCWLVWGRGDTTPRRPNRDCQ